MIDRSTSPVASAFRRKDAAAACLAIGMLAGASLPARAQQPSLPAETEPPYLRDRGTGVPTSMFGTYIRKGELILYPFFEYYHDDDLEYAPEEFGAPGADEFRGRYRASEGLLLVAFGLMDDLALELEAAVISATLDKSPLDPSALPPRIEESGVGDVEAQLRWRWRRETTGRPEVFSFSEVVFPHHGDKGLIGTRGWEVKAGVGVTRGFTWGTLTARGAIEYAQESSSHFDVGEYALEYLKRLSPRWRVYLGIEGTQDELAVIAEAQWHVTPNVMVKVNNGWGVTSKATDWAPEVGLLFTVPVR